ncbi:MAG: tetratricopeptide repeat protein [Rhodospirillales bacterium]
MTEDPTQDPRALLEQALADHEAGRLDAAVAAYNKVAALAPGHVQVYSLLGLALEDLGRLDEAAESLKRAVDLRPDMPELLVALGGIYRKQKKFPDAEACLCRSVDLDPNDAEALCSLGMMLEARGDKEAAAARYEQALAADPGYAQAHNCMGCALADRGETDAALSAFRRALDIDPDLVTAHINLGDALSKSGRHDEAKISLQRAIALSPEDTEIYGDLFLALMRERDHAAALELCDSVLAAYPGDVDTLSFKSVVLHEMGRSDEARALFDCARFLSPRLIEAPPGHADLAAFNAALREHVINHPTLVKSARVHATRFGGHTGDLLSEPKGPVADFENLVRANAEAYMAALGDDPGHPFIASKPVRWRLNVWAVVMGEKGHQVSHTHPSAWLSGVYYAAAPDDIREDDPAFAGWIEFGRPDDEIAIAREPLVERLRPQEGLMVFFPAYFYHNTVPYGGAGTRISVAFDIIPD